MLSMSRIIGDEITRHLMNNICPQEPFIDICVGGGEVPGDDPDNLMVWGITALGRVCYTTLPTATQTFGSVILAHFVSLICDLGSPCQMYEIKLFVIIINQ